MSFETPEIFAKEVCGFFCICDLYFMCSSEISSVEEVEGKLGTKNPKLRCYFFFNLEKNRFLSSLRIRNYFLW